MHSAPHPAPSGLTYSQNSGQPLRPAAGLCDGVAEGDVVADAVGDEEGASLTGPGSFRFLVRCRRRSLLGPTSLVSSTAFDAMIDSRDRQHISSAYSFAQRALRSPYFVLRHIMARTQSSIPLTVGNIAGRDVA